MRGCKSNSINKRRQIAQPTLRSYQFVPNDTQLNKINALNVILQLVIENTTGLKIKVAEIIDDHDYLHDDLIDLSNDQPLIQLEMKLLILNKKITINKNLTKIQTLIGETDYQLIYLNKLSKKDQVGMPLKRIYYVINV